MSLKYFGADAGNVKSTRSIDDKRAYREMTAALKAVGFNAEEQDSLFAMLAAILHLVSYLLYESCGFVDQDSFH